MTDQEIRENVNRILLDWSKPSDQIPDRMLGLIEQIINRKLEPEFDESKVRHGSVWKQDDTENVIMFVKDVSGDLCGITLVDAFLDPGNRYQDRSDFGPASIKRHASSLRNWDYRHIGQFDFSWPQKGQLLEEAIEILQKWIDGEDTERTHYEVTRAFLAKLKKSK